MKHKYSNLVAFLYYGLTIVLCAFIVEIVHYRTGVGIRPRLVGQCCAVFCLAFVLDKKIRTDRYVEFFDEYVYFNFLNIPHAKVSYNLNVRYEDIYEITAKKTIFGVYLIKLKADNFGHVIPLNCFHYRFKDMCKTFYVKVKQANPDVIVDEKFIAFVSKEKSKKK